MNYVFGRQDMPSLTRAQESCCLYANGLGGYMSLSHAFSMTRGDQGFLVAARTAPNDRVTLVARLQETLRCGGKTVQLSTQEFADDTPAEEGYRYLSSVVVGDTPCWTYDIGGVNIRREAALVYGENTAAVRYTIENRTGEDCTLQVRPWLLGFEKGHAPLGKWPITLADGCICTNGQAVYLRTNGLVQAEDTSFALQAYMHDKPDGRPEKGLVGSVCTITLTVEAHAQGTLEAVFSDKKCEENVQDMLDAQRKRMQHIRSASGLTDETALQLAAAADAYIARRDSTGGMTILAGYPFFGDWGRDTMIALPGCCLSTGRYDDARSILRTFFAYEKDGLVPNLFPEGTQEPMYNTVDAALLLINCVYLYVQKTGDAAFVQEAWPVMERITAAYRRGTHHGIHMDADGLICAGQGLDQVTWMDVRVGEILPTPRHGKPVEINAYWYNALKIMEALAPMAQKDGAPYGKLAEVVCTSFCKAFWMQDKRCLKDVISGTEADEQIRCNQIWAVTMPFTMLEAWQEKQLVDTVYAHLYTPSGLRTLSPEDAQYHGVYAGEQKERDMAYHQGTAWVFPLGAYYLAYLKTRGFTPQAACSVREALIPMASALREGCAGQLPEIYDGDAPSFSRGCFAQAWSVGEILRVYEALEHMERQ